MRVFKAVASRQFEPIIRSDALVIRSTYRALRRRGFEPFYARRVVRELIDIGHHGHYRTVKP